ncbi:MAG: COX15/CtaA family protein [Microthrixaceae bacterium]
MASPVPESPPSAASRQARRSLTIGPTTFRVLAAVALGLLCTIVVSGAAVRLTGSGLGCSDWPNCEPGDFVSVSNPNQAIEQLNRLFTGLVSASVIAAVLGSLRRRPYRRDLVWWSLGLVAGVLGQIVLGGITVLVELHPAAVAGHFVLSMVLVANAVVLLRRSSQPEGPRALVIGTPDLWIARVAVALACGLIITGPVVTGSGPHAGDAAAPRFGLSIVATTRVHSIVMWCFLVVLVVLLVRVVRSGDTDPAHAPGILRRGQWLLAVVVAQGAIGYTQYFLGIPPALVLAHIAGATAVFATLVWFHLGLSAPTGSPEPDVDAPGPAVARPAPVQAS